MRKHTYRPIEEAPRDGTPHAVEQCGPQMPPYHDEARATDCLPVPCPSRRIAMMPGRDPERIADTLRRVGNGSMMLRVRSGSCRTISAEMLTIAADEMDRMREYLLETSGWLHQIASDRGGLSGRDTRALANDMRRMAARAALKGEGE
jgi:hypothetical protein